MPPIYYSMRQIDAAVMEMNRLPPLSEVEEGRPETEVQSICDKECIYEFFTMPLVQKVSDIKLTFLRAKCDLNYLHWSDLSRKVHQELSTLCTLPFSLRSQTTKTTDATSHFSFMFTSHLDCKCTTVLTTTLVLQTSLLFMQL